MKNLATYVFVALMGVCLHLCPLASVAQQLLPDTDKLQLASRYYQSQDYNKAAVLYRELFETTGSSYYFEIFISCLVEQADFETAEKEIKQQLRRNKQDASLYVQWAYLLKRQDRIDEGNAMLDKAIQLVLPSRNDYLKLANNMISRGEFTYAEKLYREGSRKLPGEQFYYELGRVYLYQRDYEKMFDEYLQLVKTDETALVRVESALQSAFRLDVEKSLPVDLRRQLLRRLQQQPDVLAYNRLLIWLFVYERDFANALRQQLALDKRTGQEDRQLLELARVADQHEAFTQALNVYDYLIEKGPQSAFYKNAWQEKMLLEYRRFVEKKEAGTLPETLASRFGQTLNLLGYLPANYQLIRNYAHLLAFYCEKAGQATTLLKQGMDMPGLSRLQQDELKMELADVQVYAGDMWEAVLLYAQIIENNKTNDLGDEAKLKKARLAYFLGEMKWARAQLDVIKAGTSKMVANDALALSVFIGNNSNLDTTMLPLRQFARADLYLFRNQREKAWAVLDSVENEYPYHSLLDDIYYRKANLYLADQNYTKAAELLEHVVSDYAFDPLGDDALFLLAEIYRQHLGLPDKALGLYQNILLQHPGSVYVSEARKWFRELRGDKPVNKETDFFDGANVP